MAVSVADVMRQVNNIFWQEYIDGTFSIEGNVLSDVPPYPWVCITGSMRHDGIYRMHGNALECVSDYLGNEEFTGRVWLLKPPAGFLSLCDEIAAFDAKCSVGVVSESFGGYSRTNADWASRGWQNVFSARLSQYRKPFAEVVI